MKYSSKDCLWLTDSNISYTHDAYPGASSFTYSWIHLPSGKRGVSSIYGVTPEKGRQLVNLWNKRLPLAWRYAENLVANKLNQPA